MLASCWLIVLTGLAAPVADDCGLPPRTMGAVVLTSLDVRTRLKDPGGAALQLLLAESR